MVHLFALGTCSSSRFLYPSLELDFFLSHKFEFFFFLSLLLLSRPAVIDMLYRDPANVIPVVVARMVQKDTEWCNARRAWNAIWREVTERNHFNIPQELRDPSTRLCREMFEMIGV